MVLLLSIPVVMYLLVANIVYPTIGVKKGSSVEMMSVPLQQIAFVVKEHPNEIDEETKSEINKFLPYSLEYIGETYNPRFADPIKELVSTDYGIKPIISCWFKLLGEYPIDYISAFLTLNLPYWYAPASPVDKFSGRLYIETYTPNYSDMNFPTGIRGILRGYYEAVADYAEPMDTFPICLATSISVPFWVMLLLIITAAVINKKYILACVIPLAFWSTYLLGPVSNFRYIIPIYVLYPAMFYAIISCIRKDMVK